MVNTSMTLNDCMELTPQQLDLLLISLQGLSDRRRHSEEKAIRLAEAQSKVRGMVR